MQIVLNLPQNVTVVDPLTGKPVTYAIDFSTKCLFAYIQSFCDAINKRVASPTDKTILIPTPTDVPSNYTVGTPFGPMTFQVSTETIAAILALGQIGAGINAIWNS